MPYYPFISQPGGAGSSGGTFNTVSCTIDFGFPDGGEAAESDIVTVEVDWVTADMKLNCSVLYTESGSVSGSSDDHDPEDVVCEGITVYASNVIPGVSFDVQGFAPNDTWGRYVVNVTGE